MGSETSPSLRCKFLIRTDENANSSAHGCRRAPTTATIDLLVTIPQHTPNNGEIEKEHP